MDPPSVQRHPNTRVKVKIHSTKKTRLDRRRVHPSSPITIYCRRRRRRRRWMSEVCLPLSSHQSSPQPSPAQPTCQPASIGIVPFGWEVCECQSRDCHLMIWLLRRIDRYSFLYFPSFIIFPFRMNISRWTNLGFDHGLVGGCAELADGLSVCIRKKNKKKNVNK